MCTHAKRVDSLLPIKDDLIESAVAGRWSASSKMTRLTPAPINNGRKKLKGEKAWSEMRG